LKRIGVSGTLWGETGYDTVTDEDLWPWPNEARIKSDFSEVSGVGQRGFTSAATPSKTLTEYLWEQLGNPLPAGISP
jgi:hypothetical protein